MCLPPVVLRESRGSRPRRDPARALSPPTLVRSEPRLPFVFLCLFVAAQAYTIPVLAVGPSWTIWPTLPILTAAGLAASASLWSRPLAGAVGSLLAGLALVVLGCAVSFAVVTLGLSGQLLPDVAVEPSWGIYQLYILLVAGAVLWAAGRVALTPERLTVLKWVTAATLVWVCLSVFLTFSGLVPTATFAGHLPASVEASGAWTRYLHAGDRGLGTIGYDYIYTACQMLLLLAFWLYLARGRHPWLQSALVGLVIAATFVSGSRTGLGSLAVFLVLFGLRAQKAPLLIGAAVLLPLGFLALPFLDVDLAEVGQRQATLLGAPSTETLSARDLIWAERLEFLNADPLRWLTGTGFGSAVASGKKAHLVLLHTVVETGVLGLGALVVFVGFVLRLLWRHERAPRIVLMASVALLASSLSQESIYPVPMMGAFIPFYLAVLAVALRSDPETPETH